MLVERERERERGMGGEERERTSAWQEKREGSKSHKTTPCPLKVIPPKVD